MFRVNVCVGVCTLLSGSEFRRCIVSTIRRRRKKVRKEYERKEEDGESSSDDYKDYSKMILSPINIHSFLTSDVF
jgi:hypothetical protein